MSLLYTAGFRVGGAAGGMSCSVNAGTATIASGYYMQGSWTTADAWIDPATNDWYGTAFTAFTAQLTTQLTAAAGFGITATFSKVTGLITITRDGGGANFTMSFAGADQLRLRGALGFTGNKSGANVYTSDYCVDYCMLATVSGRSNMTGPAEADDIADEAVTDGGQDYVWTMKTNEQLAKWDQMMEPRRAVYALARQSASENGWTWQEWIRHVRGAYPFVVYGDALLGEELGTFYRLTARGASFMPRRYATDFDDYWTIPFDARWLAVVQ
jgi:hypothetical protein